MYVPSRITHSLLTFEPHGEQISGILFSAKIVNAPLAQPIEVLGNLNDQVALEDGWHKI